MTKKSAVITADNRGKRKATGRPFVKGDSRINRRGRPTKDQIGERKLWQDTFAEYLFDEKGKVIIDEVTGKPLTRLQARIRVATSSRNAREFAMALERAYGKVPQPVTGTGEGGAIVLSWKDFVSKKDADTQSGSE